MKSGDRMRVDAQVNVLDTAPLFHASAIWWKNFIRAANGSEVTINEPCFGLYDENMKGEPGWIIKDCSSSLVTFNGWIPEMWLKPITRVTHVMKHLPAAAKTSTGCSCSAHDLLFTGHRCGRSAPIDMR